MQIQDPLHQSQDVKANAVREMFASIAGRYDFLNHFLSANIDRKWRQACLREVGRRASRKAPKILDIGCGTGDLAIVFSELGPVVGCDFCHPMLRIGMDKISRLNAERTVVLVEGDALRLPFVDGAFDVVVSAFVLRNLANLPHGLQEMRRVLKQGGSAGILDFTLPKNPVLGGIYRFYFSNVLPRLGRWISGVKGPYSYLPESVRTFPEPEALKQLMISAGFSAVDCQTLTGGIAVLVLGNAP